MAFSQVLPLIINPLLSVGLTSFILWATPRRFYIPALLALVAFSIAVFTLTFNATQVPTMAKEAIVSKDPDGKGYKVEIVDKPVPEPGADQVLIKVAVSGFNPKDWKFIVARGFRGNPSDDAAGTVVKVGANVTEFHVGDRVAALHQIGTPHGTLGEYTLAHAHTTFHIPENVSFEEAATIPLAALTSVFALHRKLSLPVPWAPATEPLPLVIYGASTAIGTYAIQLARQSNIHPIIGVAGSSAAIVSGLLDESKGDAIVDYRPGEDAVVKGIKEAVAKAAKKLGVSSLKLQHAYDPAEGYLTLAKVLDGPGAKLAVVNPGLDYAPIEKDGKVKVYKVSVGDSHTGAVADKDLAFVFSRYFGRALEAGLFKGHPHKVVPGGLDVVAQVLHDLQSGKAHGFKYVVRIADTKGISKL